MSKRIPLPLPKGKVKEVVEETTELNLPIPTSDTSEVVGKEQVKAGNDKPVTEDKKDGIDDANAFMRNSYYFDEKVKETFIPLSERKIIFRFMYPNGALRAKLTTSSYKIASADAAVFRDVNDNQPFATDSGNAIQSDLPYILKKKTAQVATSNATYRVLNQAGLPMTLTELHTQIIDGSISKDVLNKLKVSEPAFVEGWNRLERILKPEESNNNNEWKDVDELEKTLEEQEYQIQIKNHSYKLEEVVEAIENEIIVLDNEALATELLGVMKKFATLKGEQPEKDVIKKKQSEPSKTKNVKTKTLFVARDATTGHIVKQFENRKLAAEFAKISPQAISAVLNPNTSNKTAGGYLWSKIKKESK